jgi:hypothetical protein
MIHQYMALSTMKWPGIALLRAIWLTLCLAAASVVQSQDTSILVVERPNAEPVSFQMADLQAMPRSSFTTSTVWTQQADLYEGVLLIDLLRDCGIDPGTWRGSVTLLAIDGYSATLTHDLITDDAPLLAFFRNGETMSVRNQGPVWAIFPYDKDASYRTESIYAMSVWQLRTLRIAE